MSARNRELSPGYRPKCGSAVIENQSIRFMMILGFIGLFYVFSEKILYDLWFEVERVSIYFIAPELCPQIDDILLCA